MVDNGDEWSKPSKKKHCPSPKYVIIYRPDLCNLQIRKKPAKKVTKNWNWPFLISQWLKTPIPTLAINLRWSETRGLICKPELYSLQTRKKSE